MKTNTVAFIRIFYIVAVLVGVVYLVHSYINPPLWVTLSILVGSLPLRWALGEFDDSTDAIDESSPSDKFFLSGMRTYIKFLYLFAAVIGAAYLVHNYFNTPYWVALLIILFLLPLRWALATPKSDKENSA